MTDGHTLLSQYARTGSDSAFQELVSRYMDLVYSTAFRLVGGDAQSAQDATQTVFLALAEKARTLPKDVMLGGWLHQHTRFVAGELMRTERRRQLREREVAEMNAIEDHTESNLAQVAPVLDDAIGQLDAEDRAAILLRFFEQKDFRSVGEELGTSEDAARKRVDRALEKLHALLKHRGATLSVGALGTALATQAVTAAPAWLAASVAGTALAGAAAGGGLGVGALKFLASTKALLLVGVAAVALVIALLVLLREPSYNGRPLSYWIGHTGVETTAEEQRAALAAFQDKAIPILIKRLQPPSRPSPKLQTLEDMFPRLPLLAWYRNRGSVNRQTAIRALGVLGPAAREAIPALEALDPESDFYHGASVRAALASIKQTPLPPYIDKLKDTSDPGWYEAYFLMCFRGTNAVAAIPSLIAALEATTNINNSIIPFCACAALSSIHSRPEVCVPALIPMLKSPSYRQVGLLTLAAFGSDARPAWTEITNCLADPVPYIRANAAMALKKIDADAASKAGAK
ncbi:MAG: sigma-70 family RNA polymerase sigma factor [Verrucomicrobia bacterium]|nr:sigma-70 family RNA polymerase sigma factor [Verrucomicrobiota bacterium]